jgi:hypothetical protein
MSKLKILGNCQVGGIADTISLLFTGIEATGEIAPTHISELSKVLDDHLENQGFLVLSNSVDNLLNSNDKLTKYKQETRICFPSISFAAFHPDIQYAFVEGSVVKNCLGGDWNSRILMWAYLNDLSHSSTRKLFCEEIYQALGYFEEWARSTENLHKEFDKCEFDYLRWIRAVQRTGVFMYGINHPTQTALSALAIQLAEKIFPNLEIQRINLSGMVSDYLSHIIWPVYPEIGVRLGLESSYHWRHSKTVIDLNDFIEMSFTEFNRIDLRNRDVKKIPATSIYEEQILRTGPGN